MRPVHVVKLRDEEEEVLRKLSQYYHLNKTDVVRMLIYKEARNLGLIKDEEVPRK